MRRVLASAVKQAVIISIAVVAVGLGFNALRKDGIPLIAGAETFRVQTEAEFMKVENAYRLFDDGDAIFVDARAPLVFSAERIEGALNVPPAGPELEAAGWLSGTESTVICYASEKSQRQAGVVADKLIDMGAGRVFVLYGGLEAWKAAGYPTDRD
jgi:rhodanese-related sulfurtransferase